MWFIIAAASFAGFFLSFHKRNRNGWLLDQNFYGCECKLSQVKTTNFKFGHVYSSADAISISG